MTGQAESGMVSKGNSIIAMETEDVNKTVRNEKPDGDEKGSSLSGQDEIPLNGGLPADVPPETVEFMQGLIESFNASATKLKEAYTALQAQFDKLNLKLEETNRELSVSLQEQERLSNYLTNILESLSSGVLVVDTKGRITLFNQGAEIISGITVKEALGKHYREVMGNRTSDDLTPLSTLSNGERRSNMEKPIVSRSGKTIPVGFSTSPLVNKSGEMIGAVEIFMDLSMIRALEEEISRMDKLAALGQMAATMAHKIRNPLGGIAGFAGLLQLDLEGNENGLRLVGKITEGVDKLNRIVSSLLSYTAQLKLDTRLFDMKERIEHVVRALKEERPEETDGILFVIEQPGGSVSAEVDLAHFNEALLNIGRNAVEALAGNGVITVHVLNGGFKFVPHNKVTGKLWETIRESSALLKSRQPCAVVTLTDTGDGMDDEVMEKLFVPFFTTKENGTGLGLAAAQKIIEAHHGEIWVSSIHNEGTAVGMVFPRTSVV